MMKSVAWVFTMMGFGWFSYVSVPLILSDTALLAQGISPDITIKDLANVGGFAIFAFAMYRMNVKQSAEHREDIAKITEHHREDMREERNLRERAMEAHVENHRMMLQAVNSLAVSVESNKRTATHGSA